MSRIIRRTKFALAIVETIVAERRALHGARICQLTRSQPGSVYPLLHRLEEAGWLKTEWESINDPATKGRPRRKYYWLTAYGQQQAIEFLKEK